ncbi:MAG: hypothetical protein ACWGHH_06545 [Sulfurovaceae bacterium]
MDRLTNTERIYPHIYLAPTIDNTEMVESREVGAMCGIGYMDIGNPLYPLNITRVSAKTKNIETARGGNPKNETLYHIKDHLREGNARVLLGRLLGATSTLKILKGVSTLGVIDTDTFDVATTVNIFGVNGLKDWGDVTATGFLEIAINLCPQNTITVDVDNVDDYMTISLYDEFGEKMYSITGHTDTAHTDDYGNADYIGMIADERVITIKVNKAHADYESTFSITETFTSGLVADLGDANYASALEVLRTCAKDADYMASMGITDVDTLQSMIAIAKDTPISVAVDVKAATMQLAVDFVTSVGAFDANEVPVSFIWNRTKYKFPAGTQNIGLSGWFTGRNVKRNLSNVKGMAEYRNSGIAGIDHPVPRVLPYELAPLTNDEKIALTKARINTVEDFNGRIVLTDILSSHTKNTQLMKFPTGDSLVFIKRKLGQILDSQMFRNLQVAKSFTQLNGRILFEDCQKNAYFDSDVENAWELRISDENSDTVVAEFTAYMEGVMRKGKVLSIIQKK